MTSVPQTDDLKKARAKADSQRSRDKRNADPVRRAKYLAGQLEWKKKNPDKVKEARKKQYQRESTDPERSKVVKAKLSSWRQNNRDKVRAHDTKWRLQNPDKVRLLARVLQSRRRARVREAGGTHTKADIQAQLIAQKGQCYWCASELESYHVDHIIALARGGTNAANNICCACPTCNMKKGHQYPWIFCGRLI